MPEYDAVYAAMAASWALFKRPRKTTGFLYAHYKSSSGFPLVLADRRAEIERRKTPAQLKKLLPGWQKAFRRDLVVTGDLTLDKSSRVWVLLVSADEAEALNRVLLKGAVKLQKAAREAGDHRGGLLKLAKALRRAVAVDKSTYAEGAVPLAASVAELDEEERVMLDRMEGFSDAEFDLLYEDRAQAIVASQERGQALFQALSDREGVVQTPLSDVLQRFEATPPEELAEDLVDLLVGGATLSSGESRAGDRVDAESLTLLLTQLLTLFMRGQHRMGALQQQLATLSEKRDQRTGEFSSQADALRATVEALDDTPERASAVQQYQRHISEFGQALEAERARERGLQEELDELSEEGDELLWKLEELLSAALSGDEEPVDDEMDPESTLEEVP